MRRKLLGLFIVVGQIGCGEGEKSRPPDIVAPDSTDAIEGPDTLDATDVVGRPDTQDAEVAPVDPCTPNPCAQGECQLDGSTRYRCDCPPGAFDDGTTCATCAEIGNCAVTHCTSANDATCIECAPGHAIDGAGCRELDACAGDPCGDGTCIDQGLGVHSCDCAAGDFDDAGRCVPCAPSASCSEVTCTSAGDVACLACVDGFILAGGACVDRDDCADDPCGAGRCTDLGVDAYACSCNTGHFDNGTRCETCTAVPSCLRTTCTNAADTRCTRCADGFSQDGVGGCVPNLCDAPELVAGVPRTGNTLGRGDNASGCNVAILGGSFIVGKGAEDQTWSFTLPVQTLVTITVTGFDAGIYLRSGATCESALLVADACIDSESGNSETLSAVLDAGRYWVLVDGYADASSATGGPYTITLDTASPCAEGAYASVDACLSCAAIDGCTLETCSGADDAQCLTCAHGYLADGAGGCEAMPCPDQVLEPGISNGTTVGRGDHTSGCVGTFADGSEFELGAGAEDETWSLVLSERTRVKLTVTGFDSAIYLLAGNTCSGAELVAGGCSNLESGPTETLERVLEPGQYWVIVDGFASGGTTSGGPYTIELVSDDPCGGIAPTGTCDGDSALSWCIVPPRGISLDATANTTCSAEEACRTVDGAARCYPAATATTCDRELSFCDGTTRVSCDVAAGPFNFWQLNRNVCPGGCVERQQGAYCATAAPARERFEAQVSYEYRRPDEALSDWAPVLHTAPVGGAVVYSWRKKGNEFEVIDTAVTDENGAFAIDIASPASPADKVVVYAARNRPLSEEWALVVAEPALGDGVQPIEAVTEGTPYAWTIASNTSGRSWLITEPLGSAAFRLFDVLSLVHQNTADLYYRAFPAESIVVWLRIGTDWECGECMWGVPSTALGRPMMNQMFVPGDTVDAAYWADSVTLHESGHWVMEAFGAELSEGGTHRFGVAYYPGLAWSEGWATWLSADWRRDSRFVGKQSGTMFWIDIARRTSFFVDTAWPRPVPTDGLLGLQNEFEISSMLWGLSTDPEVTSNALYRALGSERGRVAGRGYTAHTWNTDDNGIPIDVVDTGNPAVVFADFLDALVCAADPSDIAAHVDAVTEPATHYAYPSAAPICDIAPTSTAIPTSAPLPPAEHGASAPMVLTLAHPERVPKAGTTVAVSATLTRTTDSEVPLSLTLNVPRGARLIGGKAREVIHGGARVLVRNYLLWLDQVPADDLTLTADWQTPAWGATAVRTWAFGRPETRLQPPPRSGPELVRAGRRLGKAIALSP